jgi:O-antigen/teichoic acid export membrane protein
LVNRFARAYKLHVHAATGAEGGEVTAGRLILHGAAASGAGMVGRLGARLAFLVVAGQLYGADLFGAYVIVVAIVELAVGVAGLGMKRLVFQYLDERGHRPERHVLADAAALVIAAGAVLAAGTMLAAVALPAAWLAANSATALLLLAPAIVGQALVDLLLAATRWKHRIRYEVIGRSIVEPWAATAAAATFWLLGFETMGLALAYWCGTLAVLAYALAGVRAAFAPAGCPYRILPDRVAAMLRSALPNTATDGLSAFAARVDLYLVGALLGERAAGVYGMARQLALPIRQVRQGFDAMLTPLIARTLQAEGASVAGRAVASATRLVLSVQLALVIALVAVGYPLLHWLGPAFAAGWVAAVLLACAEAVQGAFGIGELLLVYRRPALGLGITAGTVVLALVAGFVLTSAWGLEGAAASLLLTYCLRAWARRAALKASLAVAVSLGFGLPPLLAGAAGAVAALLTGAGELGAGSWTVALAAGLAVYLGLLFVWMRLSGESLALRHFDVAEAYPASAARL